MQLTFTADEFRLLLDLLLARERESELAHRSGDHILPIAQKALNHDLRLGIDELEDLEDFLKDCSYKLQKEIDRATEEGKRDELLRRKLILQEILDRVTEACAMA